MSKKVLSATIDEEILEKWKEYTEEECINSSQLIEKLLKEHLKKKGREMKSKDFCYLQFY